jgi:hypothetical protein
LGLERPVYKAMTWSGFAGSTSASSRMGNFSYPGVVTTEL